MFLVRSLLDGRISIAVCADFRSRLYLMLPRMKPILHVAILILCAMCATWLLRHCTRSKRMPDESTDVSFLTPAPHRRVMMSESEAKRQMSELMKDGLLELFRLTCDRCGL